MIFNPVSVGVEQKLIGEPGLDFTFDKEKLQQYAVDTPSVAAGPSPWGQRCGAGMYLVSPAESEWADGEE